MRAPADLGDGVWFADTRILSEFRMLIGGVEPEPVEVKVEDGCATFELRDGGDRFLFADASLLPVLQKLEGKLDTVRDPLRINPAWKTWSHHRS